RKSRKANAAREREKRERYAEDLFSELNEEVFKSSLPKETKLTWNKRLLTTAGRASWRRNKEGLHYAEIELSEKILDCKERIGNTLSHEMCHLATWIIDADPKQAHGRLFKRWASKVMKKRPEIEITTRHNYEISYPYQWKCQKCAKIYGRFSKSIRPDECVCGACKEGRLVPLFTAPQTSQGTSTGNETAAVEPKASPSNAVTPSGGDGVIDSESEVELLLTTLRNVTLQ
ncbi:SprT-like family-domain-containing protein, partial [Amanita rubescens]